MLEKMTVLDLLRCMGWGFSAGAPLFCGLLLVKAINEHDALPDHDEKKPGAGLVVYFYGACCLGLQVFFGVAAYVAGGKS